MVFWGVVLILVGILPGGVLFLGLRWVRRHPQVSRENIDLPANGRVIRVIQPQIESRYEYRLSGVVVLGDNKPDHTFDFYLLHDMKTLALYEQGQKMPYKKYQYARRVLDWRTYMQTGPGLDFALVFVNLHPYEMSVHVKLDYYPHPWFMRGVWGSRMLILSMIGLLGSLVGVVLVIAGFVQGLL